MGEHDGLFKRIFSVPAHAEAELRAVLPTAVAARIDPRSLVSAKGSFVDEKMKDRHTDLLFHASLGGRPGFVYFLFEHQSEPDALMPWRILHYVDQIWDGWVREREASGQKPRSLPPIVTVVVHHGAAGWTGPRRLHQVIDGLEQLPEVAAHVPELELFIDDLVLEDDVRLAARAMQPIARVVLFLLRDGRDIESLFAHLPAWTVDLGRLAAEPASAGDLRTVLNYILRVAGELPFRIVLRRVAELVPAAEAPMASAAEQLIQEGIAKGIERGIEQGIEQGHVQGRVQALRGTLLKQLTLRFGAVDANARQRIEAATAVELERWVEAVVVATSVEDALGR